MTTDACASTTSKLRVYRVDDKGRDLAAPSAVACAIPAHLLGSSPRGWRRRVRCPARSRWLAVDERTGNGPDQPGLARRPSWWDGVVSQLHAPHETGGEVVDVALVIWARVDVEADRVRVELPRVLDGMEIGGTV
jgi:hypothetical protein